MKDTIKLSDHFTYRRLIRFTLPSIAMMIFTSIYSVVDGIFVSNFVGETPFASLNLIIPFILIIQALGFTLGPGGSALVAVMLGRGERKKANEMFSLVIYSLIVLGAVFTVAGILLAEPVARLLGADESMLGYCVEYARICFLGTIPVMLQYAFQSFFITAEKPKLGLYVTLAAGVSNMLLDWILVGVLKWGLKGAAVATVTSMVVGGGIPVIYFFRKNSSLLRLGKTRWYGRELLRAAGNGASEFVTDISMSLVSMLYNFQLMKYAGQSGVAAYGIIMYTNFLFIGIFFGYAMGVGPVIGYHYGAGNEDELKNVFKRSIRMIVIAGFVITVVSALTASVQALIFASQNEVLLSMAILAIRIYSINYLFCGINVFGSSFFTALNNGLVSAVLSSVRAVVFQVIFVFVLPAFFGLTGIWISIVAAELCSLAVTLYCLIHFRKRYKYI